MRNFSVVEVVYRAKRCINQYVYGSHHRNVNAVPYEQPAPCSVPAACAMRVRACMPRIILFSSLSITCPFYTHSFSRAPDHSDCCNEHCGQEIER